MMRPAPRRIVPRVFALTLALAAAPSVEAQSTPAPAASPSPECKPSQLLEPPLPGDARLGIALVRAARGELEAAVASVAELAKAGDGAGVARDRLDREYARLVALAAARRVFLIRCVADQRKLRIEVDGKTVGGTATEITADGIVLASSNGKKQEVAFAALDPDELLKRMSELKLETDRAATRAYAALLAGRRNWSKGIEGSSDPDAAALRVDAAELPALLATGAAGCAIEELARAPLPSDAAGADATLAAIASLLSKHGGQAIVVDRKALLRKLAAQALARRFDANGIAGAGLVGQVHPLGDGAVRLTYEFDAAAELDDFAPSDAAHPSWKTFKIERPPGEWSHVVEFGALQAVGQGSLRHLVEFEAPLRIQYEICYGAMNETLSPYASMRFSLCEDVRGSMVTNCDLMCIDLVDRPRGITRCSDPEGPDEQVDVETPYEVHLEHDGKVAKLKVADRPEHQIAAASTTRGTIALYWKSDAPNRLQRLVIEGRVAPDGLRKLRERAVGRGLAALFRD